MLVFPDEELSPQRHRGHREKFLFVGRYRQTKMLCPEVFNNRLFAVTPRRSARESIFDCRYLPTGEKKRSLSVLSVPLW
jgi:hypothetical protein